MECASNACGVLTCYQKDLGTESIWLDFLESSSSVGIVVMTPFYLSTLLRHEEMSNISAARQIYTYFLKRENRTIGSIRV